MFDYDENFDEDEVDDSALIRVLFDKCGELMLAEDLATARQFVSKWSALDHTVALSAEIKRDLALDTVMLRRSLLRNFVMEKLAWRGCARRRRSST